MAISKVSEITNKELAEYLKLDYATLTDSGKAELDTLLNVAKSFIKSYTGIIDVETTDGYQLGLDAYPDFVIVVYVLVQDMYDNRVFYVDKTNLNKVVDTILNMHSANLLPSK
jgi:hypothetical protein